MKQLEMKEKKQQQLNRAVILKFKFLYKYVHAHTLASLSVFARVLLHKNAPESSSSSTSLKAKRRLSEKLT